MKLWFGTILMFVVLGGGTSCETPVQPSAFNDTEFQSSSKHETSPLVISAEIRAILDAARAIAPIDTTRWFAYGVLDRERTEKSALVGYFNAKTYEVYRFTRNDEEWVINEILEQHMVERTGKSQTYTKAIAKIYTGPNYDQLRDTWYVPGNQQTTGDWEITEQYITSQPNRVEFIEGTEVDAVSNIEHQITFVGPWKYCRYFNGTKICQTSNNKNTFVEVLFNGNTYPSSELTVTYHHEVSTVQAPAPPTLISPSDGAILDSPITYSWNASSGNGTITYQLQVDDNSNFTSPFFDESGFDSTSKTVGGYADGGVYYWRVRATNEGGSSAWSSVRTHTARVPPPTPSVTGSIQNGHPKLSWSATTGASSYEIYKRTDTSSWSLYVTTTATSYTDNLANIAGYQGTVILRTPYVAYYVKARSAAGATSTPSSSHYYDLEGTTPEFADRN